MSTPRMLAKIRTASALEAEDIAKLHVLTALQAYAHIFPAVAPPPTVDELADRWSSWLNDDNYCVLVAGERGNLAGVVLTGPDPADGAVDHLSRLYVDPSQWGLGIGRALYDACLDHLAARGFTTVTLWVLEANQRAGAWYERLGWQLTGERKAVFAPAKIDDVRYRLQLG